MRQMPILMYHWFRPNESVSASKSPQMEITPDFFDRQMRFLKAKNYKPMTLKDAMAGASRSGLPAKPIVITFDDGAADFATFGRPVLEKHGFTATLFVVSGRVGGDNAWDRRRGEPSRSLMTWDQIAALHKSGFEIGSHTHTHASLGNLTHKDALWELTESRKVIADKLGVAPEYLAYPYGDRNERIERMASDAGYKGACAVALKWRHLLRSDIFCLKRMPIKGNESMLLFRLRLVLAAMIPLSRRVSP